MQHFQKLAKRMLFFPFEFVLIVYDQIFSPFQRSQSLGNAAIQFLEKKKKFSSPTSVFIILCGEGYRSIMKKWFIIWGLYLFLYDNNLGVNIPYL